MSRAQHTAEVAATLISSLGRALLLFHILLFDMLLLGVLVYLVQTREEDGGVSGTVHSVIATMLHKVPIPNPLYDCDNFVIHTWGCLAKYKFIQRGQKMFTDLLIFCYVFVLPEHFAVNRNRLV
jgi:hypothetical protein